MKAQIKQPPPFARRDATGHLNPKYAADLRKRSLASDRWETNGDQVAFVGQSRTADSLADALGREFVEGATTGEGAGVEAMNQRVPEEDGGPFVVTKSRDEFAKGDDPSNPPEATREPFPTTGSLEAEEG